MFYENKKTGQAYRVLVEEDPISEINTYDRLSFWTDASDVEIKVGNASQSLQDVGNTFFYAENVLRANTTEVIISGDNITTTGLVDIYVPDEFCKLSPNSIERNNHTITITFPVQEVDIPIRVVCKNYPNIGDYVNSTPNENDSDNENDNENNSENENG